MDTSRHFENNFAVYNGEMELLSPDKMLCGSISNRIKTFLTTKLNELEKNYNSEIEKSTFNSSHDSSVYTGTCGIVFLSQKLNDEWKSILPCAERILLKAHAGKRRFTFLCGDAGPLALKAIHYNNIHEKEKRNRCINNLINLSSWSSEKDICNEVLYGRAGYLYSLLLLKQTIDKDIIPDSIVEEIVTDLINAGEKEAKPDSALPLHYEWHEKEYIGAAHGYIGIFYMLLQVKVICPNILKKKQETLLINSIDNLLNQCFSGGNIRSSFGSDKDRLIHWCHGAPGAVHLYALAYKVYRKASYLSAAEDFAINVWSRGLLQKGYGICHGVAGNGYAHLCMYQLTNNELYLWRAIKFAEWCLMYGRHGCRTPDRPYSLFEGLAGTLFFLHDILKPTKAMFPAFQLLPYC